ncbi:MAG: hypothetical protein WAU07_03365 [Microgenomates group bacterium]
MRYFKFILVLIVLGVCAGVYKWSVTPSVGTNSGQISDRAKEFLETQPVDDRIIQPDELEAPAEVVGAKIAQSDCFIVQFPITVRNVKTEKTESGCIIKATSDRPKAHFTITSKKLDSFEENSGIKLRESDEKYSLKNITVLSSTPHKFFVSSNEGIVFIDDESAFYTVALYDTPRMSPETEQILIDLAKSIKPQ